MSLLVATLLATAGSSVASDTLGRGTWVVDPEQDKVWRVPASGAPKAHAVGRWPEQLVVAATGTVFVTCREEGRLDVIDDEGTFHVELPGEPRGLALDEARGRLWVGLVAARELVGIDTGSLEIVDRRPLERAPRAIAVNGQGIAVLFERGGELALFARDPKAGMSWSVKLPSFARHVPWHGFAIAEAGAREDFVIAHSLVDTGTQRPASNGHYGGGLTVPVMVAVSVIHEGRANLVTVSRSIDWRGGGTALGLADVTGIAWHDGVIALSSRGTSQVLAALAAPNGVAYVRAAMLAVGAGAAGVAFDAEGTLLTWAAFDRKLTRARYGGGLEEAGSVAVGKSKVPAAVALGRRLFHSASSPRLSAAGLSCSTCHVDGREDGLVWRLEQSVRQTPALAGRLKDTEPYTWLGTAPTLEQSIAGTITRLGGKGLSAVEQRALAKYLSEGMRSLPRLPEDDGLVARGRELFHSERTSCSTCHPSDGAFTDGALHAIARATPVDTPSLRGVALTAPYYHDGSMASLEELIEKNGDRMGTTSSLSGDERRALAAYLRSL